MIKDRNQQLRNFRKLARLRKEIFLFRTEFEKFVAENAISCEKIRTGRNGLMNKTLYFIRRDYLLRSLTRQMQQYQRKLNHEEYSGIMRRDLWLPTVIEAPLGITICEYLAHTVKTINLPQARAIAKKAGLTIPISEEKYRARYQSGKKYLLRVEYEDGVELLPFTNWAVCIFQGAKTPKFRKNTQPKCYKKKKIAIKRLILAYQNTSLFFLHKKKKNRR